ncbi:uncharacterized protein VTP21DRAFT_7346 [Calcarisporiella thermophila]|uniref:uncharacterized protein n=1 Tax=Calcarisporiella thermophila TaxID=911321 RepID=UPI0037438492
MSFTAKGALRTVKNYTKGYSDVQTKVREATSNDGHPPSAILMSEIARLTYNEVAVLEILDTIDKRLNDKGKNWRHVYKSLSLLEYCLIWGSERVIAFAKGNLYIISTLRQFQHIDEHGRDVGANVREKAKDVTNLLLDGSKLMNQRRNRQWNQSVPVNNGIAYSPPAPAPAPAPYYPGHPVNPYSNVSHGGLNDTQVDEDLALQQAIEESKRSAFEHEQRMRANDVELSRVLELSEREAMLKDSSLRRRKEEEAAVFAEQARSEQEKKSSQQQSQPQDSTNDSLLFDISDSQPVPLNTPSHFMMPQPHNISSNYGVPTPLSINTAGGYGLNSPGPLSAQPSPYIGALPGQNQFSASIPYTQFSSSASNNPFAVSNNTNNGGFASGQNFSNMGSAVAGTSGQGNGFMPSISTSYGEAVPGSQSQPYGNNTLRLADKRHENLANLLANKGEGVDTFGNVGNLRIPSGTGFNSRIASKEDNIHAENHANNPFSLSVGTGAFQQNNSAGSDYMGTSSEYQGITSPATLPSSHTPYSSMNLNPSIGFDQPSPQSNNPFQSSSWSNKGLDTPADAQGNRPLGIMPNSQNIQSSNMRQYGGTSEPFF